MEKEEEEEEEEWRRTRQLPRLKLIEINFRDDLQLDLMAVDLPLEIVSHKLFIRRMESESRWQRNWRHSIDYFNNNKILPRSVSLP